MCDCLKITLENKKVIRAVCDVMDFKQSVSSIDEELATLRIEAFWMDSLQKIYVIFNFFESSFSLKCRLPSK